MRQVSHRIATTDATNISIGLKRGDWLRTLRAGHWSTRRARRCENGAVTLRSQILRRNPQMIEAEQDELHLRAPEETRLSREKVLEVLRPPLASSRIFL